MRDHAKWVVAIAAIVVLALGVWGFWRMQHEPAVSPAFANESQDETTASPRATNDTPTEPHATGADAAADAKDAGLPEIDRAKRDAMRVLIWRAFGEPLPSEPAVEKKRYVLPTHGPGWTPNDVRHDAEPGIEPEYIQQSVRSQFFPIALKCYTDSAIATAKGRIDLWFVIVGDAKIGGIVESVDVLDKSTLRDPDFIECLRQSFLGVTFPPPKGGGMVTVEYPIVFSPDDDDGG